MLAGVAEELVSPCESKFVLNDPNDNVAFLPFGSGTRACVGQKFVIQGVMTLFASLLEQYEVCANLLHFLLIIFYIKHIFNGSLG